VTARTVIAPGAEWPWPPYSDTIEQLKERIRALIPTHPNVLDVKNPWDLFKIPEFNCDDLAPSFAQAAAALRSLQLEAQGYVTLKRPEST